jgi:hypothetical protein
LNKKEGSVEVGTNYEHQKAKDYLSNTGTQTSQQQQQK